MFLKSGASLSALAIGCFLTQSAQARPHEFAYPETLEDTSKAGTAADTVSDDDAQEDAVPQGLQITGAKLAPRDRKFASRPSPYIPAPNAAPAAVAAIRPAEYTPVSVALVLQTAPLTAAGANAADQLPLTAVERVGQENRARAMAANELASMLFASQRKAAKVAGFIGAQGESMMVAFDEQRTLALLAPAAGTPGGNVTPPVATMPPAVQAVAVAPVPVPPTPALVQSAPTVKPSEIMDLPSASVSASTFPAPAPAVLSSQSKEILDKLPPEPEKPQHVKGPLKITHAQKNPLDDGEVKKHEGVGISISVRKPKPNISHMLEEAYDALIAGNQEDAITLYKNVLTEEPANKLALFGLATTYHRAGQLQLARPLYGQLLAIDPNNQEGLNNFLVLLGDESPGEAILEMKKLQHTHPDFSPLPAQMAIIYERMGDYDQAIVSMKHAIELSPENIKYRYDIAIMLDRRGDWDNAAVFYQQLITASDRGEKIPAKPEEIQERLTFIRSNKFDAGAAQILSAQPHPGETVGDAQTGSKTHLLP